MCTLLVDASILCKHIYTLGKSTWCILLWRSGTEPTISLVYHDISTGRVSKLTRTKYSILHCFVAFKWRLVKYMVYYMFSNTRDFPLAVQWLIFCLPLQQAQVQSLVRVECCQVQPIYIYIIFLHIYIYIIYIIYKYIYTQEDN